MAPPVTSGLVLHLDATTLGLAEGASVSSWTDDSGLGRNATQATASKQPMFHADTGDGLPGVEFDGTDDVLGTAVASFVNSTDGSWTAFAVTYPVRHSNDAILVSDPNSTPRIAQFLRMGTTAALRLESIAFNSAGSATTDNEPISLGHKRFVLEGVRDATTVRAVVDGTSGGAATTSGTPITGSQAVTVGDRGGGSLIPFAGFIHEVLLYDRALTSTERDNVRAYLAARWPSHAGVVPYSDDFNRSFYRRIGNLWRSEGGSTADDPNFSISGNVLAATATSGSWKRWQWFGEWPVDLKFEVDLWFPSSAAASAEVGIRPNGTGNYDNRVVRVVQDGLGACEVQLLDMGVVKGTYAVSPPTSASPLRVGFALEVDPSDATIFTTRALVNGASVLSFTFDGADAITYGNPFVGVNNAAVNFDNASVAAWSSATTRPRLRGGQVIYGELRGGQRWN